MQNELFRCSMLFKNERPGLILLFTPAVCPGIHEKQKQFKAGFSGSIGRYPMNKMSNLKATILVKA